MRLSVLNSGIGLRTDGKDKTDGQGIGLANIKSRLRLHYGDQHTFGIREVAQDQVEVTITLPLQFSASPTEKLTRFGA